MMTGQATENRWICIYPSYIDSKKTLAQGRIIPQSKAVEMPTSQEILDVIEHGAGLPCVLEKKMYPRDANRDQTYQGRVRVQLKNEDGTILNEKFPTRKSVMIFASEMIPKLKTRQPSAAAASAQPTATKSKQKRRR